MFGVKKFLSYWMMPLPLSVMLLLLGVLCYLCMRRKRLGQGLVVAGTVLLVLFTNKFVSTALVRPLEARYAAIPDLKLGEPLPRELAACRFVVVLGGGNGNAPGLSANNQMSVSALSRITEAVRLLRLLPEARLITTGPTDSPERASHAVMLRRVAESLGVDPVRCTVVEDVRDTEDESLAVKKLVGTEPFALVTSAWHLPRTMALFRHAGLTPLPCPADYSARGGDSWQWTDFLWDVSSLERSTWAVRERIGYVWIWLRGRG